MTPTTTVRELLTGFFTEVLEEQECADDDCHCEARTNAETKVEAEGLADQLCSHLVDSGYLIAVEADY